MKLTITDEQTLDALVTQHAESRTPVQTMIVQAACNARASSDRSAVRTSLSRLKAVGFVARTASDRWMPTKSGIARATGVPEAGDKGDDGAENCSKDAGSQPVEQGVAQCGGMEVERVELRYVCAGCGEMVGVFQKHDCSGIYSCDAGEGSAAEQEPDGTDSASSDAHEDEETVTVTVVNGAEGFVSLEVPADSPAASNHRECRSRPESISDVSSTNEKDSSETSGFEGGLFSIGGVLSEQDMRQPPGSIRHVSASDECFVNPGCFGEKPRSKYHREIQPGVWVDIYDVLVAWEVQNPALQHLIKKALAPGQRGHKDLTTDLNEIVASAERARELCK